MNINIWQSLFLGLLQGVTELFPISSLGHTVILPGLFGWGNLVSDTACGGQSCFLPLIVALHLGTSIALLLYFWRDWLQVGQTLVKSVKEGEVRQGTEEWVSWLIIIGCIPAGLLGVFLETPLKQLFASPLIAATFLVVNGSVLFLGESLRRRAEADFKLLSPREREARFRPLASLSWKEALVVGSAQALALIPGFSRSGMTIVAGLGVRLTHEDSARYSFLLGTPIIFAAAILEVPLLFQQALSIQVMIFAGMVVSGVAAFLSTKFLMKYFETGRLDPFAYYCWAVGIIALILFLTVARGSL
ncbi:MAG TPA: undecaprenyl-diphosphate phosphatase [Ktedonosporobacter sp.]|jgi:undecaprenyl-diphosphatase|nr:undecaprenyl-diphosphate phosphatase [Ktedonosporobacter sp.]